MIELLRLEAEEQADGALVVNGDEVLLQRCGGRRSGAGIAPCAWSHRQNAFIPRIQQLHDTGFTPLSRR